MSLSYCGLETTSKISYKHFLVHSSGIVAAKFTTKRPAGCRRAYIVLFNRPSFILRVFLGIDLPPTAPWLRSRYLFGCIFCQFSGQWACIFVLMCLEPECRTRKPRSLRTLMAWTSRPFSGQILAQICSEFSVRQICGVKAKPPTQERTRRRARAERLESRRHFCRAQRV